MGVEEDLKTAFAGESQANRKYLAFAQKAEKDGFPNVALMFKVIAEAETVHALNHFRVLGAIKSTKENLEAAKTGENYEVTTMYPPMEEGAKKAGNKAATSTFHFALETEKLHHGLYNEAIQSITAGKDITKKKYWVCPVCGCTGEGEAPAKCPICGAKKELFKKFE
ncbi:MAG: rubrerythrin family protein [Candidatus Helarchaeota archaeon]|nr:rubrerythrin family protein [Candidatus Helarchaeota archaeon]